MTAAVRMTLDEAVAQLPADELRRAVRHMYWRQADLSYLLHDGQALLRARWRESTARRFVANIGRGWGKSFWGCVEAVECALRIKGAQIRYAAPEQKMVDSIVSPHMQTILADAPPDLRPEWKEQKGYWLFPNGSKIFVAGANAGGADRLRGVDTHLAVLDEARDMDCLDYLIKSVITPRLTEEGRILIPSTPPEMPDHPLVAYIAEAQARGAYMNAPTSEAPHITPARMAEFLEDYVGPHDPAFRREFLAEIIVDPERAVLPELSEHEGLIVEAIERPAHALLHVIGDAGFEDMDVFAFGFYDYKRDLDVIEDEVIAQRSRSDLVDALVAKKERDLWGTAKVHRRRIDAQPRVRADMSREEWQGSDDGVRHWAPVTKGKTKQVGSFRASVNAARVRMARGRVRVHPRCKTILAHGKFARWATNANELERVKDEKGRTQHHFDGCAALVYFLRDLDRATNPWPLLEPGVTHDTHHISPDLEQVEAKAKIRRIFGRH